MKNELRSRINYDKKLSLRNLSLLFGLAVVLLAMSSCKKEYSFKTDKTKIEACGDGDTLKITVETDAPEDNWNVKSDVEWMKVTKNKDNVEVILQPNTSNADGKDERTADIVFDCKDCKEEVKVTVTQQLATFIDLGINVKWATCNMGAKKPEEKGDYFAWGELHAKTSFSAKGSVTHGKKMGDITGNPNYDAARAKYGPSAHIPTMQEADELVRLCSWKNTTRNGVQGQLVKGPNGNSIFLPRGGRYHGTTIKEKEKRGYYWTSTHYESDEPLPEGWEPLGMFASHMPQVEYTDRSCSMSIGDDVVFIENLRADGVFIRAVSD